jgi:DNA helicase IV
MLSSPTEAERKSLGDDKLAQNIRLACQTRIEKSGEVVVQIMTEQKKSDTSQAEVKAFRKKFAELPLDKKLSTLVQLEVVTMSDAMNAIIDKSVAAGEKVMDTFVRRARTSREQKREAKRPTEHRRQKKQR